jgi:serine/threonine protein kinase
VIAQVLARSGLRAEQSCVTKAATSDAEPRWRGQLSYRRLSTSLGGRQVALKRLPASASATLAALFEREYSVLASLQHPSIVRAFDYGRDAEGAYYTTELIEGSDLSKCTP